MASFQFNAANVAPQQIIHADSSWQPYIAQVSSSLKLPTKGGTGQMMNLTFGGSRRTVQEPQRLRAHQRGQSICRGRTYRPVATRRFVMPLAAMRLWDTVQLHGQAGQDPGQGAMSTRAASTRRLQRSDRL